MNSLPPNASRFVSPKIDSVVSPWYNDQNRKLTLGWHSLPAMHLMQMSPTVSMLFVLQSKLKLLFLAQDQSHHTPFGWLVSLVSLTWPHSFHSLSLPFMNWHLAEYRQSLFAVSWSFDVELTFLVECHRINVMFSTQGTRTQVMAICLITVEVTFDHLVKIAFTSFSIVKLHFSFPFLSFLIF